MGSLVDLDQVTRSCVTPTEFHSAGLTVQNLLSGWLGSEDAAFVPYHLRRTAATLLCHSLLPLGEPRADLRDPEWEGRGAGSREVVPGPSVFPSREPSVSGNFCGRIKGVKYRFALKEGTWDFPGDTGNFGQRGSLPQTRRGLTLLSQLCRDPAVGVRNGEDLFLISSASVRSIPFLSFIEPIFA